MPSRFPIIIVPGPARRITGSAHLVAPPPRIEVPCFLPPPSFISCPSDGHRVVLRRNAVSMLSTPTVLQSMSLRNSEQSRQHAPWYSFKSPTAASFSPGRHQDPSTSTSSSFELLEHSGLLRSSPSFDTDAQLPYAEGSTIDWHREEALERDRTRVVHDRRGWRGVLGPALDSTRVWLVIILTGVGVGIAGAWLDVLVRW